MARAHFWQNSLQVVVRSDSHFWSRPLCSQPVYFLKRPSVFTSFPRLSISACLKGALRAGVPDLISGPLSGISARKFRSFFWYSSLGSGISMPSWTGYVIASLPITEYKTGSQRLAGFPKPPYRSPSLASGHPLPLKVISRWLDPIGQIPVRFLVHVASCD